jgi:acetyl coenzyme A synthetase (ADP forming)-like protein
LFLGGFYRGIEMDSFFKPSSVAVIGATSVEKKVGYAILRNLIKDGYSGNIYPVNPKRKEILGLKAYNSIQDLPQPPRLAILAVPPRACLKALDGLGPLGTRAAVIISAGFKETGEEGTGLEKELVGAARKWGIRLVGPNCLGIMDTHTPLNATFATVMPPRGNVAVISQSGALLSAFFDWSIEERVGFSKVVSLGNQADLSEADFLSYLADDPESRLILVYVEGVAEGGPFLRAIQKASTVKPVFLLKVGRTEAGKRASSSHTGSITGSDQTYDAAFRKGGAIRVAHMEELFAVAKLLSFWEPSPMERVAVLTNAGGPGIMAADAIALSSMKMATLPEEASAALKAFLPGTAGLGNPVDVIGDADAARFARALDILLEVRGVDSIIVLLTPQLMTEIKETAQEVVKRRKRGKHIVTAFMGRERVREGVQVLREGQVPNYDFPEEAVMTLDSMNLYLKHRGEFPLEVVSLEGSPREVERVIGEARLLGHHALDEYPAMKLLQAYGIPVIAHALAEGEEEAVERATEMGFPVVMKLSSPRILHKSDLGGVITGIGDEEGAREACRLLMERAREKASGEVRGVLVEEMASPGLDVVVGFLRDPTFGPVLMFGLGGIYVEVLKDVTHALAPVSQKEALDMIKRIKASPLLQGVRGGVEADLDALARIITRFSHLALKHPELAEGEMNPLRVTEKGAVALDARFTLKG